MDIGCGKSAKSITKMLKDYAIFSLKNLRNRKLRSWLTMIGIFIGIAAVISLIGLGEGLRLAIMSQFGFLGPDVLGVQASGIAFAGPPGSMVATPLSDELAGKIEKINGVEAAFNRYIESSTLEFNNKQDIGIAGSAPEGENRKIFERMLNLRADEGRLLKDGDTKKAVVGNDFKKEDAFGKGIKIGDKILVNDIFFEVVGILEKKGSFIFDRIVMINEKSMIDVLGIDKKKVDVVAVKVKDQNRIVQVKEDIEKLMRRERNVEKGEEDFQVESPQQTLETLNSTLFAVTLFVYIIAGISIAVGGIGIMNTMYTSVLERTKEIGIMKSIGARNSAIFTIFFVESGLLGTVGGIIGIALGMSFAYGISFAGRYLLGSEIIQASVSPFLIIGALIFSFGLGTLFGVLPAYRASKLNPVDSLRSAK
ncbi:ABC transporter permease [Candidatus Woesearchaeota archaeon]|nr:ABC transporter permease [Candidatus Woesearchaeota archaeon]